MVNFRELQQLDVATLKNVADGWDKVHDKLNEAGQSFEDNVTKPLGSGEWEGDAGNAATKSCKEIRTDVDAVTKQVKSLRSYLDEKIDGSGKESLKTCQDTAFGLQEQVIAKGMSVDDKGEVTWSVFRAPGPLS